MNSAELKNIIAFLGLTQEGTAALIGVSPRALRNWLKGDHEIPGPAVRLLRLLAIERITPQDVEDEAENQTVYT